jgi:O-antigen/teichoic acid export membrane protein
MTLRGQATSLAILHAADILQPLLILPYAARVLEPVHFGQYAYAMSIGQIASTVVEYGFHWTAQREAASARQKPAVIATIFADVFVTKAMLCLVVTVAGLAAANSLLALSKPMFLCAMLTSAGGVLFPAWLFIGLERAWQATVAVVVARSLALVCFLTMVTSPDQLELAVASQAAIPLLSGVVSLPFIVAVGFSGFKSMTLSRIGMQLRSGWRGFLFSFVERALMTLPIPLVQHFGGYAAAGQYSIADKFVGATRPFFRIITDTFLPRVAYCAVHDPAAGIALIWKSLSTVVVGAALSLFLFFFAPFFIIKLFGDGFADAIPIVRVMSAIPVLVNANICTSNLYMFNYGHERAWASLTASGLVIFVAVGYLLSFHLANAAIAVAIAVIAREGFIFVVSGGFFLTYCAARTRVCSTQNVGDAQASGIAATFILPSFARAVAPWRDQPRTER